MINKLSNYLTKLFVNEPTIDQPEISDEVAVCVLLVEIMRADSNVTLTERTQIKQLLTQHFALPIDTIESIITTAEQTSDSATDYFKFTHLINNNFTIADKIKIVTLMWQVAYADGTLDAIEEHTIRRMADLLHLRHSEYIQAKLAGQHGKA